MNKARMAWLFVVLLASASPIYTRGQNTTTSDLEAPRLSAVTAGQELRLEWEPIDSASGYKLYYAEYPDAPEVFSADLGNQTNIIGTLPIDSAFWLAVQAYNESAESEVSNIEYIRIKETDLFRFLDSDSEVSALAFGADDSYVVFYNNPALTPQAVIQFDDGDAATILADQNGIPQSLTIGESTFEFSLNGDVVEATRLRSGEAATSAKIPAQSTSINALTIDNCVVYDLCNQSIDYSESSHEDDELEETTNEAIEKFMRAPYWANALCVIIDLVSKCDEDQDLIDHSNDMRNTIEQSISTGSSATARNWPISVQCDETTDACAEGVGVLAQVLNNHPVIEDNSAVVTLLGASRINFGDSFQSQLSNATLSDFGIYCGVSSVDSEGTNCERVPTVEEMGVDICNITTQIAGQRISEPCGKYFPESPDLAIHNLATAQAATNCRVPLGYGRGDWLSDDPSGCVDRGQGPYIVVGMGASGSSGYDRVLRVQRMRGDRTAGVSMEIVYFYNYRGNGTTEVIMSVNYY